MNRTDTDCQLLSAYAEHQRSRGFSPATVRRRATSLASLTTYISPQSILHCELAMLEEWIGTLSSARTRHAYLSDARCFYRWAVKRKLTAHDPTTDIDPVRVPRSLPRPIDPAFIRHLLFFRL